MKQLETLIEARKPGTSWDHFVKVSDTFATTHAPALLAKLKRYEEALRFYAYPTNYSEARKFDGSIVQNDEGQRARGALEKTDE